MFEDKTLVCKDCGAEFIFSAGEQEFYAEKGFQNEPIRCKACRNARKSQRNGEKEMYDAVCAQCGASFPRTTGPSIAALASKLAGQTTKKRIAFPCKG